MSPTALILSRVMVFRHMGEGEAAESLDSAVAAVIAEGEDVTYDLKPYRGHPTAVGASEMGDAVIAKMQ